MNMNYEIVPIKSKSLLAKSVLSVNISGSLFKNTFKV